jgi:hypothetical protein
METIAISKEVIAERAFEIFKSRGGKPGNDLEDWLHAERELAQTATISPNVPFQSKKSKNVTDGRKYAK